MDLLQDPTKLQEVYEDDPGRFITLFQELLNRPSNSSLHETPNESTIPPETAEHYIGSSKSEKHPDPPVFAGNPSKWKEFKTQLRVKLFVNADRYPTSQSRLAYCVSRLQGNPLNIITPRITGGQIGFNDYEALITFLDAAYEDPDKQLKAQRELRELRQGRKEFYLYFADFQRIIEDTGITGNEARKSALMGGLSTEMLQLLIHHDIPVMFDDLVKLLQSLDSRYRQNLSRNRDPVHFRPISSNLRPTKPFFERPQTSKTNSEPYLPPGDPMDIGTARRVNDREKERRTRENLCYYCGKTGHFARDCYQSPKNQGSNRNTNPRPTNFKLRAAKEGDISVKLPSQLEPKND